MEMNELDITKCKEDEFWEHIEDTETGIMHPLLEYFEWEPVPALAKLVP